MRRFYAGTYSQGQGDVFTLTLQENPAKLELTAAIGGCENASFLALRGHRLYAVSEREAGGELCTYAVAQDGGLTLLSRLEAPYPALCHLSVWPDGKALSAASYLGGGVCTCALRPDGVPVPPLQWIANHGQGPRAQRQASAHAHSITPDPAGRFGVLADLGTDELWVFAPRGAQLTPVHRVAVPAGEGPRHFAFHPSGAYGYLVTELANHVIAYGYDAQTGRLWQRQVCPLLEGEEAPDCLAADIHLSPDGRFLYASVRGVPYLVRYRITPHGLLEDRVSLPCGAAAVRNFCMDRSGCTVLVADQLANEVRLFARDPQTGDLSGCLAAVRVPSPVCIIEA